MVAAALAAGFVGCALFVATFLVDGVMRPCYRPLYHPVSALALGSRGWVQTTNFVVSGTLLVIGAAGAFVALDNWFAPPLLAILGVALVASGVFPMDPMRGYPPGTPTETPTEHSRTHRRHDNAGAVVFGLLPFVCFVLAFALAGRGWTIASVTLGIVIVPLLFVFNAAWERDWPLTGLIQRAILIVGLGWIAVVYLRLLS